MNCEIGSDHRMMRAIVRISEKLRRLESIMMAQQRPVSINALWKVREQFQVEFENSFMDNRWTKRT